MDLYNELWKLLRCDFLQVQVSMAISRVPKFHSRRCVWRCKHSIRMEKKWEEKCTARTYQTFSSNNKNNSSFTFDFPRIYIISDWKSWSFWRSMPKHKCIFFCQNSRCINFFKNKKKMTLYEFTLFFFDYKQEESKIINKTYTPCSRLKEKPMHL